MCVGYTNNKTNGSHVDRERERERDGGSCLNTAI